MHTLTSACLATCLVLHTGTLAALGAPPQFPYQATVQTDEIEVRAGPAEHYYVTGTLRRGQQVTIHRHDRGGWYMITPPPGSFSWIDSELVQRQGTDAGVVQILTEPGQRPPRAVVRIGSSTSNEHSLYGRELATGDRVRILGEETLNTERGAVRMLKIEPPPREYRWIKGDFLVAVDPLARQQQDLDPYRIPSAQLNSLEFVDVIPAAGSQASGTSAGSESLQFRVFDIDEEYAEMMLLDPAQWDLDRIERQYLEIQQQGDPGTRSLVDHRLNALAARRQLHAEYLKLQEIRDATSARDMELQSMHAMQSIPAMAGIPGYQPPTVELGLPGVMPALMPSTPFPVAGTSANMIPQVAGLPDEMPSSRSPYPGIAPPLPSSGQFPAAPVAVDPLLEQLCGAGIVQRLPNTLPGQPTHALVAPDGRLLTLLLGAEGVQLDELTGASIGIIGERSFQPQLQSDLTIVRQIVPVQLVR